MTEPQEQKILLIGDSQVARVAPHLPSNYHCESLPGVSLDSCLTTDRWLLQVALEEDEYAAYLWMIGSNDQKWDDDASGTPLCRRRQLLSDLKKLQTWTTSAFCPMFMVDMRHTRAFQTMPNVGPQISCNISPSSHSVWESDGHLSPYGAKLVAINLENFMNNKL